jgi:hypothetical protein
VALRFEQASIGVLFILLAVLWVTRDLFFVPGWEVFFGGKKYVTDATPAILIVVLLFMWPKFNIFKGKSSPQFVKCEFDTFFCFNSFEIIK